MSEHEGVVLFGVVLVVGGAFVYRYAYTWARLQEQEDAIGSTTDLGDVEPTGWRVGLTKIGAVLTALIGLLFLVLTVVLR